MVSEVMSFLARFVIPMIIRRSLFYNSDLVIALLLLLNLQKDLVDITSGVAGIIFGAFPLWTRYEWFSQSPRSTTGSPF